MQHLKTVLTLARSAINQFFKCTGLIKWIATAMIQSIISEVVGAKVRKKDLSCDHQSSMGLKSGE
jgi:hypothetical protein